MLFFRRTLDATAVTSDPLEKEAARRGMAELRGGKEESKSAKHEGREKSENFVSSFFSFFFSFSLFFIFFALSPIGQQRRARWLCVVSFILVI